MNGNRVKVGIVGLGRWAKVLTRAARTSAAIEIVSGFSRSEESRAAFQTEFGVKGAPDLASLLADPNIKGVILTVPNEQHLPLAREVAKAGKHVYTEKPIASTLEEGLAIEALEKTYGVTVTVGHSARLMAGIRAMGKAIAAGELRLTLARQFELFASFSAGERCIVGNGNPHWRDRVSARGAAHNKRQRHQHHGRGFHGSVPPDVCTGGAHRID